VPLYVFGDQTSPQVYRNSHTAPPAPGNSCSLLVNCNVNVNVNVVAQQQQENILVSLGRSLHD
jgi:hypothetical protein